MNELRTTLALGGAAVVLAVVALVSAPGRAVPDAFFDIGEPFFPEFTDPEAASTLEVVEFDEATAAAIPFQVTNRDGLWTIPSHNDYPADGAERLSNIAADIISVVKEDFRSDNVADHEALGVIDPTDLTTPGLVGRGDPRHRPRRQRRGPWPTSSSATGSRPGRGCASCASRSRSGSTPRASRPTSAPRSRTGSSRTCWRSSATRWCTSCSTSTRWTSRPAGPPRPREFTLDKVEDNVWDGSGVPEGQEVNFVEVNRLVGAIIGMEIAGGAPQAGRRERQPPGRGHGRAHQPGGRPRPDQQGLLPDPGGRPALERRESCWSGPRKGVLYTLRFGEIVYGRGEAIAIGDDNERRRRERPPARTATCSSRPSSTRRPSRSRTPSETDAHESWQRRVEEGREKVERLAARFANWYLRGGRRQLRPHPPPARALPAGQAGGRHLAVGATSGAAA